MKIIVKTFIFLFSLFIVTNGSFLEDVKIKAMNIYAKSQEYSCLNPKDPNFLKVCDLSFFPPSTNITADIRLTGAKDLLLSAHFPSFDSAKLSKAYLSSGLQTLVHLVKLDTIKIEDPALYVILGLKNQAVRFSAKVSIFALQDITMDLIVKRVKSDGGSSDKKDDNTTNSTNSSAVAKANDSKESSSSSSSSAAVLFGLSLPFSSIPKILEAFFPINLDALTGVFNADSTISLVLTNGFDFDGIDEIEPEYISRYDGWESPGLGLYVSVKLTSGDNVVSNFLRKYIGPDAALLMAMTIDTGAFKAFVGIADFTIIPDKLTMKKAGVGIEINRTSPEPKFYIEANMVLNMDGYDLIFNGKMTFTATDFSLQFTMLNVWLHAFGIERFYFGNLLLSGGITYAGVPSGFSCGGEVAIGLDCYKGTSFVGDGYCLMAKGYVGVNIKDPKKNFFYVKISALSLDSIMRSIFGSKDNQPVPIPKMVNEAIYFPQGLEISYSLTDNSGPGFQVKAGYLLRGEMHFFGVIVHVDFQYHINDFHLIADCWTSAINLGSVFQLTGNSSTTGPYVKIDAGIKPSPKLLVDIAAQIELLGIRAFCFVHIGLDKLFFNIGGPILGGLLEADMLVELNNNNWKGFDFHVMGQLRFNQALFDLISWVCNNVAQALHNAKDKIDESQRGVEKANNDLQSAQDKVCQNIFDKCKQKSTCKEYKTECSQYGTKSQCSKYEERCTGGQEQVCSSWSQQCKGFWGAIGCWFKSWICSGWKWVCKATSSVCTVTVQVIDYAVCVVKREFCVVFNWVVDRACELACGAAQVGLEVAQGAVNLANIVMEGAEKTLGGLARLFELVGKNVGKIFNIKSARFDIMMNAGNKRGFNFGISVNLNMVVLGKEIQKQVVFTFGKDDGIKKALSDTVMEDVKKIEQPKF